jgi:hypothetical protein
VPTFGLEIEPLAGAADSDDLDHDLGALFTELGALGREAEGGVVFFFDELQLHFARYLARAGTTRWPTS